VKRLVPLLATLGPVGYAPIAPATVGSAVTCAIGWFLPVPPFPVAIALIVAGAAVAIWLCGVAEKTLGHDAHPIVADEVVGQSIALLLVPHTVFGFGTAFLLFRLLDIWKPFGAREAQKLPGGWGVVADDVIAGIVACLGYHLGAWALPLVTGAA
jgi:phosphatidylglycerophosphatase A